MRQAQRHSPGGKQHTDQRSWLGTPGMNSTDWRPSPDRSVPIPTEQWPLLRKTRWHTWEGGRSPRVHLTQIAAPTHHGPKHKTPDQRQRTNVRTPLYWVVLGGTPKAGNRSKDKNGLHQSQGICTAGPAIRMGGDVRQPFLWAGIDTRNTGGSKHLQNQEPS